MEKKKKEVFACYISGRDVLYINSLLKTTWAVKYIEWRFTEKEIVGLRNSLAEKLFKALQGKPEAYHSRDKFHFVLQDFLNFTILMEGKHIDDGAKEDILNMFKKISEKVKDAADRNVKRSEK